MGSVRGSTEGELYTFGCFSVHVFTLPVHPKSVVITGFEPGKVSAAKITVNGPDGGAHFGHDGLAANAVFVIIADGFEPFPLKHAGLRVKDGGRDDLGDFRREIGAL
jgi:hypothetical protein